MKTTDKFRYCKVQTEEVEVSPGRYESIGIDLRSEPVESETDRVCCHCGESLSADGMCDQCEKE